jgi:hypothetical protein
MTILVAIQFFSPQTAWVNKGIGDNESSGFSGTKDFNRVPGVFSFTNGLSIFYGFVTPFIFFFYNSDLKFKISKTILFISTICLLLAIPLSLSRGLFFSIVITAFFLILTIANSPKMIGKIITLSFLIFILVYLIVFFHLFDTVTNAFIERFTMANESEGGVESALIDRVLGGMYKALTNTNVPYWGFGLGMGTNAGSKLLTGSVTFLISEGEWGRIIGEMGLILGLFLILIRFSLCLDLLKKSWLAVSSNNILPWLLYSSAGLSILNGQWGQPTTQGFSVFGAGLILASLKE